MECLADGLSELPVAICAWQHLETVRFVAEVDVHHGWGCRGWRGREHALPVRKLAAAEVAELLTPRACALQLPSCDTGGMAPAWAPTGVREWPVRLRMAEAYPANWQVVVRLC